MTNYSRKSFNVAMGAARISEENWERTFGKKPKDKISEESRKQSLRAGEEESSIPEPRVKETVPVSGVWIRTREETKTSVTRGFNPMKWTILEVLVEVDGTFRLIQSHRMIDIEQMISHITEPAGMRKAPEDEL